MVTKTIDLGNNNELIINTRRESFTGKGRKRTYFIIDEEIILRSGGKQFFLGICSSNTYTGNIEFIQYNSQCIVFCRGNIIKKTYSIERVFDIERKETFKLSKDEILEKYNIHSLKL